MKRVKFISNFLYVLIALFLTVSFTGCEKSSGQIPTKLPSSPTRTYSAEDLFTAILQNGVFTSIYIMPDKNYVLTTKDWIQSEFSAGLSAFQFQMGMNNWTSESNDCDKFASATTFYAKWLNHSSPNRSFAASLACGEVYYKRGNGGHAINFFIIKDQEKLKILFYEPQTRLFVSLTDVEVSSIFFWKL